MTVDVAEAPPVFDLVLESGRTERHYWRDLWRYRELFYFLAWRDLLVRYKQTVIGVVWALARPLLTMLVFTFVFSKLAKLDSGGVPYPIVVFAALLPWQFFSSAFSAAAESLLNNAGMISKVYFPRLIIPISSIIVAFVDFLISLALLAALMAWYHYAPSPRMLLVPVFALMAFGATLGASLWIAALNVKYRDFRIIVPFIVQFGLYISPVGYLSSVVPDRWRTLYALNPMVGIIDGFRWAILGGTPFAWDSALMSLLVIAILLVVGVFYFRKTERNFADII